MCVGGCVFVGVRCATEGVALGSAADSVSESFFPLAAVILERFVFRHVFLVLQPSSASCICTFLQDLSLNVFIFI